MRIQRRLLVPVLSFLAGAAVPLALGAATVGQYPSTDLGRLGRHRLMPNSLVFDHRGELFVLNYHQDMHPVKIGMTTFMGTIHITPMREMLDALKKEEASEREGAAPRAEAPRAETVKARR
jgi:hypothetical protein